MGVVSAGLVQERRTPGATLSQQAAGSGGEGRKRDAPEICTVDISAFFREDEAGRAAAGEQVRRACEGCGLFYITGHGLSALEAEEALDSSRSLFLLPDEEKKSLPSCTDSGFIRGFIGVGGESGSPTLFEAKVESLIMLQLTATRNTI